MHKMLIQEELRINPPFLKRNLKNYKIIANRNFPTLDTCNIITIKGIECTNKKYTKCKIIGYKYINNCKSTRISHKIDLIHEIDFNIINYSCYESTVLYFYMYDDNIINKFILRYNSCDVLDKEYFRIFENNECLLIKYITENKKNIHYKPVIVSMEEFQTSEKICGTLFPIKNFSFISKHRKKIKKEIKQEEKIKSEMNNYIGYFLGYDIDHPYKELMIKWNELYIKSADFKGKKIDLIIEFINKEPIDDLSNFIYLFYSRQLINKEDLFILKDACFSKLKFIPDQDS